MTVLDDIAEVADELTDSRLHSEPISEWDHNRHRRVRHHRTIQPGLLAQLADCVPPTPTDENLATAISAGSRPPLSLEALARHTAITIGVVRLCWSLKITLRDTTESNIRAIVGAIPSHDQDTQLYVLTELRRWRHEAAVLTGWASPNYAPYVPCPVCDQRGRLRINTLRELALCLACHSEWTPDTYGILAAHIDQFTDHSENRPRLTKQCDICKWSHDSAEHWRAALA